MSKKLLDEETVPLCRLDADGKEVLDNSPVAIPVRFQKVANINEQVRKLVEIELSRLASSQEYDSFDDADDFDVGDDFDPRSPYELDEETISYDHRDQGWFDPKAGPAGKGGGEAEEGVSDDGKNSEGRGEGSGEGE